MRCGVTQSVKPYTRKVLCEPCWPLRNKEWQAEYRQRTYTSEKGRAKHLKSNYGLTQSEFDLMLEAQNGVCAICGGTEWGGSFDRPKVDHCHDTKVVRGLLCQACNLMIGHAKDDIELLAKGIEYLKAGARVEVWV